LSICSGAPIPEERTEQIEDATQGVRAPGQGRGKLRLEQRALGDAHVDQVVEAVVEDDLRIHDVDREGAEEHLEHVFVEEEVHRALGLRIRARRNRRSPSNPRATFCT
jgi:hypothetical protein